MAPSEEVQEFVEEVSPYAVHTRYPGNLPDVSVSEATRFLNAGLCYKEILLDRILKVKKSEQ